MGVESFCFCSLNMLRLLRFAQSILGATPKQVIYVASSQNQFILFQYMICLYRVNMNSGLQLFHRQPSTLHLSSVLFVVSFCFHFLPTSNLKNHKLYCILSNHNQSLPETSDQNKQCFCIILFRLIALLHVIVARSSTPFN